MFLWGKILLTVIGRFRHEVDGWNIKFHSYNSTWMWYFTASISAAGFLHIQKKRQVFSIPFCTEWFKSTVILNLARFYLSKWGLPLVTLLRLLIVPSWVIVRLFIQVWCKVYPTSYVDHNLKAKYQLTGILF